VTGRARWPNTTLMLLISAPWTQLTLDGLQRLKTLTAGTPGPATSG
jgi:hypothetical protein